MRFHGGWLVCAIALAMPLRCAGFEADVHFGLTLWLARQAGFAPPDAEAIALADQRIDAGSIEYMTSPLQYACLSRFLPDAVDAQARHYPGTRTVPADAQARAVAPGGPAALAPSTRRSSRRAAARPRSCWANSDARFMAGRIRGRIAVCHPFRTGAATESCAMPASRWPLHSINPRRRATRPN